MLAGARILLGVTGSIAAYQATDLIGLLKAQLAPLSADHIQAVRL